MLNKRRTLKLIAISILFMAGFHISGIESAFCDDSNPMKSASHGCQVCQVSHHSAVALERTSSFPVMAPVSFSMDHQTLFMPQEPAFYFFRPPISL
jgi:hypothetical protein